MTLASFVKHEYDWPTLGRRLQPVETSLRTIRLLIWSSPILILAWLVTKNVVPSGRVEFVLSPERPSPAFTRFASEEVDRVVGTSRVHGRTERYFVISRSPMDIYLRAPREFLSAKVTLVYRNDSSQPRVRLGAGRQDETFLYRDIEVNHPVLAGVPEWWQAVSKGDLTLWQKDQRLYREHLRLAKLEREARQSLIDAYRQDLATLDQAFKRQAITRRDYRERKKKLEEEFRSATEALPKEFALPLKYQPPPFATVDDFLRNLPDAERTLQFNYDLAPHAKIRGYQPAAKPRVFSTSLRGSHTLLTYLGRGEELSFAVTARNLNRLAGRDQLGLEVSTRHRQVFESPAQYLGEETPTSQPSKPTTLTAERTGLPEGFYFVRIKAADELLIERIETRQRVFLFLNKFSLAENAIYQGALGDKRLGPTTVYTDSEYLTAEARSDHGLQTVTVGSASLDLIDTETVYEKVGLTGVTQLISPKNELILRGDRYFALSPEQFDFLPHFPEIGDTTKVDDYDFVFARYPQNRIEKGWTVAQQTFRKPELHFFEKELRFLLEAPGLREELRQLKIKEVRVELSKPPLTWRSLYSRLRRFWQPGQAAG